MRQPYPSDMTREQFKKILPILESARKKAKPRKIELYDAFFAILYILKSGCQWGMLPKDFQKYTTCYYYFQVWTEREDDISETILEIVLKKMVGEIRKNLGRKEKTSFLIIDAQSVKTTDCAENKDYDAGKKIAGIKRHIGVDTNGLPHVLHVTTADITDRNGALEMFEANKEHLSEVENSLLDGGYSGKKFATAVKKILGCEVEIVKRNGLHKFVVLPKRWVAERSFAWLEKYRRLWKNCERKIHTSLQMMVLAFAVLLVKRF